MASRRGYLTQTELAQYADITITDPTEADDQISQAEELIDTYVGYQNKFMPYVIEGKASVGGVDTLTLRSDDTAGYEQDYFKGCEIEIIGGTGIGSRTIITASTAEGVLTFSGITTDTTSFYRIYQLGKFPRVQDVSFDSYSGDDRYYKQIPEAIKRATAAQVEYVINMGDSFFASDESNKQSERIGDYSYSNGNGGSNSTSGVMKLIAPKARMLLRGIVNRKGVFLV